MEPLTPNPRSAAPRSLYCSREGRVPWAAYPPSRTSGLALEGALELVQVVVVVPGEETDDLIDRDTAQNSMATGPLQFGW